jgi:hypothetical protein
MRSSQSRSHWFVLSSASCLIGTICAVFWLNAGEPWETVADGQYYLALYEGNLAPGPFGYRVLTPYLARLLPWSPITNFEVITISSLALTTGILALHSLRTAAPISLILVLCFFWVTSFPFAYYSTTLVRVDGPIFAILAATLLLSHLKMPWIMISALIAVGSLSHETVLICIPALWLDRVFHGTMTGGARYRYRQLLLMSSVTIIFFLVARRLVPVSQSANLNYLSTPVAMLDYVVGRSGGISKHALRIYASYGPALLFSFFFATTRLSLNDFIPYVVIFLVAVAGTFLAVDTLRVMAIIYLPVLFYSASYLSLMWKSGRHRKTVLCLTLQGLYSWVVYGHLRTFESSLFLNSIAAILSILALVACTTEVDRVTVNSRLAQLKVAFSRWTRPAQ